MTTETTTTPAPTSTPAAPATAPAADVVARLEGEAKVLAEKLAEANTRAGQFAQQLAAVTTERDGFKTQVADLAPKAVRLVELEATVATLTNEKREGAFLAALRGSGKIPGADDITLRGVVGELAKAAKLNPHAEDTAAEVARALPVLLAAAPAFTRPPTSGGGSPGAPVTTAARPVSLIRPQ